MEYSDQYLQEYLPPANPPYQLVPEEVESEIRFWIEREGTGNPALLARSTRWTYALFHELGLNQFQIESQDLRVLGMFTSWHAMPGPISIGLFDPAREREGFGLIALVPPNNASDSFELAARIYFPRLDRTFPLAFRQASLEDHLLHPAGATSAAWARCNTSKLWGVLTAGHAVRGIRPGWPVALTSGPTSSFSGGLTGALIRSTYPVIDAAFVQASLPGLMPQALPIRRFPAAGQPVTVALQQGAVSRTVVETMNALGVTNTTAFAIQMFTDQPCQPGDSGALVQAQTGEAVGIYLGALQTPQVHGGWAGRVLSFEQAAYALDVSAYL